MAINIGIVIGCNNPAYEGMAQVRVPAIHGLPLADAVFNRLNNLYSKHIPNPLTAHSIKGYNKAELGKEGNNKVVPDSDVPWYPVIYPFGSNVGPNLYDLVYVLDNSYVVGWTNQSFMSYT